MYVYVCMSCAFLEKCSSESASHLAGGLLGTQGGADISVISVQAMCVAAKHLVVGKSERKKYLILKCHNTAMTLQ